MFVMSPKFRSVGVGSFTGLEQLWQRLCRRDAVLGFGDESEMVGGCVWAVSLKEVCEV